MTMISPMLQSRISSTSGDFHKKNEFHEKMYENFKLHANDVKPNEAKAKLIKEGPVTHLIHNIQDDVTDCKNFFKAVKTGQLRDNSLGRINDIGLKASVLLIAAYLASGAKTKTDAIMKFVGGGSFLAVMSLWPKLFINLPARIVHGFPIDRRYISAQGDKKDFHLDNQFKVWDAVDEAELARDAKRAGIDYYSENGREKIIRKEDKTALQNRALWMATAGFATPLFTSIIGNAVTPKIKDAVIKNGFNKANAIISDSDKLENYLNNKIDIDIRNQNSIKTLFDTFNKGEMAEEDFYKTLAKMLQLDAPEFKFENGEFKATRKDMFRNIDDIAPVDVMKEAAQHPENIDVVRDGFVDKLKEFAQSFKKKGIDTDALLEKIKAATWEGLDGTPESFTEEEFSAIAAQIKKQGQSLTPRDLKRIVGGNIDVDAMLKQSSPIDMKAFEQGVLDFNEHTVTTLRGRLKAYLNLVNPVAGHREESIYTKEYNETLNTLFSKLDNFTTPDGQKVQSFKSKLQLLNPFADKNGATYAQRVKEFFSTKSPLTYLNSVNTTDGKYVEILSSIFSSATPERMKDGVVTEEYKNFLKSLLADDFIPASDKSSCVEKLAQNVDKIKEINVGEGAHAELAEALFGTKESKVTIIDQIRSFLHIETENITATKVRSLLCANFEGRLKDGSLDKFNLSEEDIQTIRNELYNGNISLTHGKITFNNRNKGMVASLQNILFDEDAIKDFAGEDKELSDTISHVVGDLKNLTAKTKMCNSNPKETSVKAVDLSSRLKEYVTRLSENKAWAKVAFISAGVLIAVTLISQFFFGKIDKEFPENKKGEVK